MLRTITRGLLRLATESGQQKFASSSSGVRFLSTSYPTRGDGLTIEPKDQVLWIRFNRPKKFNAITRDMYLDLTDTFKSANGDKSIKAIVLTGTGDYYSSGNDLSNLTAALQHEDGPKAGMKLSADILYTFVESIINLEKFMIAAVNGPAVGIPVTTLPLFDYVIASDTATFHTPFTALGQCPEACSSVTFPSIMGRSRSSELLLLNMTWDANKAKNYGLVSDVIEHEKFSGFVDKFTAQIATNCYTNSLRVSKSLVMNPSLKQTLLDANRLECDHIVDMWLGDECADALQKFFKRSKK